MRLGFVALAALVAGSVSPLGDAVRTEVDDVKAKQYDKGRQIACNLRTLNALTSQDLAQIEAAERHCARLQGDASASPEG